MLCQKCSAENPEAAKFCIQCANPFLRVCENCGFESPPQAKFCAQCGVSLSAPASASSAAPAPNLAKSEAVDTARGERRHLTVLFCDVVGSTAIAAGLDPEQWRETLAGFHRVAAAAITQFDGHVAKNLGDGVMAYFGWPQAHDNDAERAARAGLAILDAIAKLDAEPGHVKLSVRVGIDSGPVVMGKGSGSEVDVFGPTSNVASRVESEAAAGTVAISGATHRLLAGLFVVEDLGARELKGVEQPTQLYRVVRPSGARGRFEAASAAGGLTPFVGREDELRTMTSRWQRALDGDGQVALIIGEAGIGKSRLLQRFHEEIADTPHTWIGAGAGAFFQNTPFYPVVEMLRQFVGDTPPQDQLAQLETRLELAGLKPADAIPLIAPLLNLQLPTQYPPSTLSPEQQRRRLLATLVEWVLGSARAQPVVIATEDLHWVDPSTLELIQLLVEQGATARLLLLYTTRPEFHAPWPMRAHHTQLTLNRLSARNVRTMVAQVAASKALADDTIATVIERTGGIPLFVEELTRDMLERGGGGSPREIPATLHDSLMARLDRLGPDKEVLQIGSVMGSEFSYELLHAVHPIAETDLQRALRAGTDAELLYVRGIAPDATYQFKHALIRDAAYEALLKTRRKELHLMVARTIDEQFPALKETHPEVLARHWTEAGEIEPAIAEWTKAGANAADHHAYREAEQNHRAALTILDRLPESPERDRRELDLRLSVVSMLHITRGYSAFQTIEAIKDTTMLAEKSGNLGQLVNLMLSRCLAVLASGDLKMTIELADQALDLALRDGSPTNIAFVRALHVIARYHHGDLAGVETHFTAGLDFFADLGFRQLPGLAVSAFGVASWNAWILGRAGIAAERLKQMIKIAINPYDVSFSREMSAQLSVYRKEYDLAEMSAASALELAEKEFPYIATLSRCSLGQARSHLGKIGEGIALIRQGIAGLAELKSTLGITHRITSLAEAHHLEGAVSVAIETSDRSLQANTDELVYRPPTLRLRGELYLKQKQRELAEADFREAIALSQSMSAKAWELRAITSLARLLRDTGRRDEARTILADIYKWFTEGFDTADLIDAKALLDELS
jgi:class 3 adenylate cyclase/tetratricopeptide (TPR) repeat protein/ribosomal protein L40E